MQNQALTRRSVIVAVLILQVIPLLLFPPSQLSLQSQGWWLAAALVLMVAVADIVIVGLRSPLSWPWYLVSFAQGFNIISRLMMLWPNMASPSGVVDVTYVVLTIIAVLLSTVLLWYTELPDVRNGLVRQS